MRQTIILTVLCGLLALSLSSLVFATEITFTRHIIATGYRTDPCQIRVIDMDGDSDMDLVTGSTYFGQGDLSWWENDGSQNFIEQSISSGEDNIWEVEVADMDNDGDWDILTMRDDEYVNFRVTVWVNDGNENFTAHDIATPAGQLFLYAIDLDADADTDIVAAERPQTVLWMENQGNLSFAEHVIEGSFEEPYGYAADLDSDGDVDVMALSRTLWQVDWWENDGSQNFTRRLIWDDFAGMPHGIGAADLDSDGDVDVVVGVDHYISAFENDGNENFSEHVISTDFNSPASLDLADLDSDGDIDVLAASYWSTYVRWLENGGNFSFSEHTLPGAGSYSVRTADLDGDYDLDVMAVVRFGREIAWWESDLNPLRNVDFDIKPQSCPNPLNLRPYHNNGPRPRGVLPTAILGTEVFHVNDVDPATVTLEGVSALRWDYEDVAAPVINRQEVCDCTEDGPDGYLDLTLKFSTSEIIEALGQPPNGELPLTMAGMLYDGTEFEGVDCVVINNSPWTVPSGEPRAGIPESYLLKRNIPNPFNVTTTITFGLPEARDVTLDVYNLIGQKVATLVEGEHEAGYKSVTWDASEISSGIYFYKLTTGAFTETKRMTLLK